MSWNHRVMRTTDPDGTLVLAIHEVYYHADGTIKAWTVNPTSPSGETIKELQQDYTRCGEAFRRHILDVRGDDLYDIGLTGRTRGPATCVYHSAQAPAGVPSEEGQQS